MTTFDSQNIFVDFIILHFTVFFTFQLRNIINSVKKKYHQTVITFVL